MPTATCTFLLADPLTETKRELTWHECGAKAQSAIFTKLTTTPEKLYASLCPSHLAEECRLVAEHEVCDFRVERYHYL